MEPKWKRTKKTLRTIMEWPESTFQRRMKDFETDPEFKSLYPGYNRNDRLLSPAVFKWLLTNFDIDDNQIIEQFIYHFDLNKKETYHLVRFLGLETNLTEIEQTFGKIKGF